jgi:hypothetical protein
MYVSNGNWEVHKIDYAHSVIVMKLKMKLTF